MTQEIKNKRADLKVFILLIVSISVQILRAQINLVPNPDFEAHSSCPSGVSEFSVCSNWFVPTFGTSDYFHSCAPPNSQVNIPGPNHGFGQSYSHSGNAMGGQLFVGDIDHDYVPMMYREYIAVKLIGKLDTGKTYFVSFFAK